RSLPGGARKMLRTALRAEVAEYIELTRGQTDDQGHALVVRYGVARGREVTMSSGAIEGEGPGSTTDATASVSPARSCRLGRTLLGKQGADVDLLLRPLRRTSAERPLS